MLCRNIFLATSVLVVLSSTVSCSNNDTVDSSHAALVPACINSRSELMNGGWVCPDKLTMECEDGVGDPDTIYFVPTNELAGNTCGEIGLMLDGADEEGSLGPFGVGTHQVTMRATASGATTTCEATLVVQDTEYPVVEPKQVELWPPNHKLHSITPEDCLDVTERCGADFTILSASSNEPVNDNGDGNTEPDIVFGCDGVKLRAERQGGGSGRVYKLEWLVSDEGGYQERYECMVTVPHDQSGDKVLDDGTVAYQMKAPDDLDCDEDADGERNGSCECESCECDDEEHDGDPDEEHDGDPDEEHDGDPDEDYDGESDEDRDDDSDEDYDGESDED